MRRVSYIIKLIELCVSRYSSNNDLLSQSEVAGVGGADALLHELPHQGGDDGLPIHPEVVAGPIELRELDLVDALGPADDIAVDGHILGYGQCLP